MYGDYRDPAATKKDGMNIQYMGSHIMLLQHRTSRVLWLVQMDQLLVHLKDGAQELISCISAAEEGPKRMTLVHATLDPTSWNPQPYKELLRLNHEYTNTQDWAVVTEVYPSPMCPLLADILLFP